MRKDIRPMTDDDIKCASLQILIEIDSFCQKNNIKYSLAYGTLLGAIRHKGFIPWDDDIDVLMLREDYDKFVDSFNKDKTKPFSISTIDYDKEYRYPFAKVFNNKTIKDEHTYMKYGICVDVFPIDKIPKDREKAKRLLNKQDLFWNIMMLKIIIWDNERPLYKNLFMSFCKPFLFFVPFSLIARIMQNNAKRYKDQGKDYFLGSLYSPYGEREFMTSDIYEGFTTVEFENHHFNSLSKYHEYLHNLYGDYMKLPPIEERKSHHGFKAYWKNL